METNHGTSRASGSGPIVTGHGTTDATRGKRRLLRTTTVGKAGVIAAAAALMGSGTAAATAFHGAPHRDRHAAFADFHLPRAFGKVTSVNGSTATGACGVAGATGSFDVTGWKTTSTTVDVTSTTKFGEWGTPTASFADLCVGDFAGAVGTTASTGGTLTASGVWISSPSALPVPPKRPPVAYGKVTSVDGSTATGACGVAGATGSFDVTGWKKTSTTVDVTATTKFVERGKATASFADLCVGDYAGAVGSLATTTSASGSTFTASGVWVSPAVTPPVAPPRPPVAFGKVTSVDGSTATGACGVAGATGSFDLTGWKTTSTTVDVTSTTKFGEWGTPTASFADLCVGDFAGAVGTTASTGGTLTASGVWISSPSMRPMPMGAQFRFRPEMFRRQAAVPAAPTTVASKPTFLRGRADQSQAPQQQEPQASQQQEPQAPQQQAAQQDNWQQAPQPSWQQPQPQPAQQPAQQDSWQQAQQQQQQQQQAATDPSYGGQQAQQPQGTQQGWQPQGAQQGWQPQGGQGGQGGWGGQGGGFGH